MPEKLSFAARLRLEHLEELLFWKGQATRRDLCSRFGISMSKAALDFAVYRGLAPENLSYNPRAKCYLANSGFSPVYYKPDVATGLITWAPTEIIPAFDRNVPLEIGRQLVQAIRGQIRCRVSYQSFHSSRVGWREISPHAFVHDGERWHVRVFDHTTNKWCDLVLGRIHELRATTKPARSAAEDTDWSEIVDLTFTPARSLHAFQQKALLADYGAKNQTIHVRVRRAAIFYVAARLGLLPRPNAPRFEATDTTAKLLGQIQAPNVR